MIRSAFLALLTTAATLGAGSAHAGGVSWSIGINTPIVGTVVSNAPVYVPSYGPMYAPVPVYRVAPSAGYYPRPIYYRPVPVVYPRYYPGWRYDRDHGRRDHGHDRDGEHWNGRR